MAQETQPVTRGFGLRCPYCGEEDALQVRLSDMDCISCTSCEESLDRAGVRLLAEAWLALATWLDTAPAYKEGI